MDTWHTLHPNRLGLTFDGGVNPLVTRQEERMRYDRVMVAPGAGANSLAPVSCCRLGMGAIEGEEGARPSDHYGVYAEFDIVGRDQRP